MSHAIATPRPTPATPRGAKPVPPPLDSTLGFTGLIEIKDFSFFYGPKQALHNISLRIAPRTIMAFIGPSGCGKSTLLRSINRLNALIPGARHEGEILLDGTDIHGSDTEIVTLRQRVGMVFQRWNPFPKSIYDNVAFGPRINGLARRGELDDLVESSLRRAALWDEVKDRLRASALGLSGGQQQRLCIARALATRPAVLLLDEPTASLDPISTQKVEELVYELRGAMTVVIVTHNMQQAARVSDRTAFLLSGELVELAATNSLFTTPSDSRTEAYITGRFG